MPTERFYFIQKAEQTADIFIFGDIAEGPYEWLGEKSAQSIVNEIKDLDVDVINVHIDSYGGSIKEGWGMYNALREHKAEVHTFADGFVCSAAMYPFLAGAVRTASSVSAFYLHEGLTGAYGYADDLRKAADEIDVITSIGVNAFVEVAGMDEETVKKLMKDETWLTAAQALDCGIATEIKAGATAARSQSARKQILQMITGRKSAPEQEPKKTEEPKVPEIPEVKNAIKNFFNKKEKTE